MPGVATRVLVSAATSAAVVRARHLYKRYGDRAVLADVSLDVSPGEIFGLVGPNGAGKTTTLECLEGVRRPDVGTVSVLGLDPAADGRALRRRVGIQAQGSTIHARIKVWEALDLFATLYGTLRSWRDVLQRIGLGEKRDAYFWTLSGGERQRVLVGLALVHDPEIVFLDEPTAGLDPRARRAMWDVLRAIRAEGRTILLTTHSMDEAERLCDRVGIMDRGRMVALDSPARLVRALEAEAPASRRLTLEDVYLARTGGEG